MMKGFFLEINRLLLFSCFLLHLWWTGFDVFIVCSNFYVMLMVFPVKLYSLTSIISYDSHMQNS